VAKTLHFLQFKTVYRATSEKVEKSTEIFGENSENQKVNITYELTDYKPVGYTAMSCKSNILLLINLIKNS